MEGKSDDTQVSRVYLSQGKAEHDKYNQVVFLIMNSLILGKSPRLMRTTTHHVERFYRRSSNRDDIEKKEGEQKVFSVLG